MKKTSKIIVGVIITLLLLSISLPIFASQINNKAEILSKITGKSSQSLIEEKINSNKTFCEIAKELGVLDEFCKENAKTSNNSQNNLKNTKQRKENCEGCGYNQKRNNQGYNNQSKSNGQEGIRLRDGSCYN